jgi:hypothetical protein
MQHYQDLLIDALLDQGFTVDEAEHLVALQEQLERERHQELQRQEFARWLVRNSKITEFDSK